MKAMPLLGSTAVKTGVLTRETLRSDGETQHSPFLTLKPPDP